MTPRNRPRLILGAAQFGQPYGPHGSQSAVSDEDATNIIQASAQLGFSAIDTARSYGRSEEIVSKFAGKISLHTKLAEAQDPLESLATSLKILGVQSLELLYLCHDTRRIAHRTAEFWRQIIPELADSSDKIGLSIYRNQIYSEIVDEQLVTAIQLPLHIFAPELSDEELDRLRPLDRGIIVRSVFAQGLLIAPLDSKIFDASRTRTLVELFEKTAKELGRSRLEICLQWVVSMPIVSGIVLGIRSERELVEIAKAVQSAPLARDEVSFLRDSLPIGQFLLDPRHPGEVE